MSDDDDDFDSDDSGVTDAQALGSGSDQRTLAEEHIRERTA